MHACLIVSNLLIIQSIDHPTAPTLLGGAHSRSFSELCASTAGIEVNRSSVTTPVQHAELLLELSLPLVRRPSAYSAPSSPTAYPDGDGTLPPVTLIPLFEAPSSPRSLPSLTASGKSSRSSSVSTRASFFSDAFSPVRIQPIPLRPVITTLLVQINEVLHFLQLRQPVISRVAIQRLLKELHVLAQLPHPGFMREMLMEAEKFLPRDLKQARVVMEEAKEYLDLVSFDLARGKHVFPGSTPQERKARLVLRLERWNRVPALKELRFKSACLNPCYRDLLFTCMWNQQHKQA